MSVLFRESDAEGEEEPEEEALAQEDRVLLLLGVVL